MRTKKILAILFAALMLLSVCGCTDAKNADENPTTIVQSIPIGSLQVAMEHVFDVTYDDGGLVTALAGLTGPSADLATAYTTAIGAACDTVVATLIQTIADSGESPNARVIVLKQTPDSEVPSATFLENIRIDAEAVAGGRPVVLVTADRLTAEGFISANTATAILTQHLSLAGANISCAETPEDGQYAMTVIHQGIVTEYFVDADTGVVIPPDDMQQPEDEPTEPIDTPDEPELTLPPEDYMDTPTEPTYDPALDNYSTPLDEVAEPELNLGE